MYLVARVSDLACQTEKMYYVYLSFSYWIMFLSFCQSMCLEGVLLSKITTI